MTAFFKLSGAGNDFVALVEPTTSPTAHQIRTWCRRGASLGADGLLVLRRHGTGRVRMEYFNSDGNEASLCLNAARCAGRLVFHLGWQTQSVFIETAAGGLEATHVSTTTATIQVPLPQGPPVPRTVVLDGDRYRGWTVTVGVPHFILPREESVCEVPVPRLGKQLRHHPDFAPHGANVDFVRFVDRRRLEIRSYERGVEGETLACGTGILSAVATGLYTRRCALPVNIDTLGGFALQVSGSEKDAMPTSWRLTGDARVVAHGELLAAAEEEPEPTSLLQSCRNPGEES